MEKLEQIKVLVDELGVLRNTPQLMLFDVIEPATVIKFREEMIKFKNNFPGCTEVDFVIYSSGGTPDDAYRIIRTLRRNFTKVNAIVPYWSKSAATLLCLGASTLVMDEFADFGPLDIQIMKERVDGPLHDPESALNDEQSLELIEFRSRRFIRSVFTEYFSAHEISIHKNELLEIVANYASKFYKPLIDQINPYDLGLKKRKLEIGQKYAERILRIFHPEINKNKQEVIIDYLINGCPDHAFVIDVMHMEALMGDAIVPPESISFEYKQKLSELSLLLMKLEEKEDVVAVEFRVPKSLEQKPSNENGTIIEKSNLQKVGNAVFQKGKAKKNVSDSPVKIKIPKQTN